ncbi:uncharacterized protein LOC126781108 [Nymphalis io]|uniref:uncharacterized protein LOC126781108 n=1 Tax=Inachis io TaxID=171585 RepID=UPI002166D1D2|nr:uncharacterized protein LOC126781108 [Nymphalis io]
MQIRPLCAELAKMAQDELNEDPARIARDVQHIKDWLSKQPHLRARKDDQWLVAFLRGCKYSLERTKEKLDLYYSMRSLAPELFSVRPNDKVFTDIMNKGTYLILPKSATPDSPRVAIIRPGSYDPDKYILSDIFSVSILLQRILLMEDDATVISGVRTIMDLEGVTLAHYLQMTPAMMKKMAVLSQDAAPMRMKGVHYINTPAGFETVFSAIKNLLNEKNRKRLYVHNKNYEEMYSHGISKDILPVEYGGNGGTINEIIGHWKDKVQKYSSWLEEDLKYGTDESKRPGQPKTPESMFGLEGSFRQLNFDLNTVLLYSANLRLCFENGDILVDSSFKTMPVRPLPPALAEKARLELNENPKVLEESIRQLKQWILKQPHLRARTDDQWLAAFLRGCKFRVEQSKMKLDLYFSFRSTAPYLYSVKYFEPKVMEIINTGATLILPKTKNPADPRVILYRIGKIDLKQYTILDIMSVLVLQEQICFMEDDNFVVAGTVNIVDLEGARVGHYTQTSIKQLRNLVAANQDAVPVRIKEIHFLNTPFFFETFFGIVRRFMSEKSKNRIIVHSKNMESFHERVPKEILPEEYGGTGDNIQDCIEYWKNKMRDYSSFFEDDLKYGSDESKRPGKSDPEVSNEPFSRLELD